MSTSATIDTSLRCTLCGQEESPTKTLLVAGAAPICRECDEQFRMVFRTHLEPVADAAKSPLDQFMSAIAYFTYDGHWKVNLHTFRPGLVIGHDGVTADALRQSLVDLTGDKRLALNLVQHQAGGCAGGAGTE